MLLKEKLIILFKKYPWLNHLAVSVIKEQVDVFLIDEKFCIKIDSRFDTYCSSTLANITELDVQSFLMTNDIKEQNLRALIFELNQTLKMNTSAINFEYWKHL